MLRLLLILALIPASPALGAGDEEAVRQLSLLALGLGAALFFIGFVVIRGCIRRARRDLR